MRTERSGSSSTGHVLSLRIVHPFDGILLSEKFVIARLAWALEWHCQRKMIGFCRDITHRVLPALINRYRVIIIMIIVEGQVPQVLSHYLEQTNPLL